LRNSSCDLPVYVPALFGACRALCRERSCAMAMPHPPRVNRRTLFTRSAAAAALLSLLDTRYMSATPQASPEALQDATSRLVEGNINFAFDLYHELRSSSEGNLLFSPYSLSFALAMAYAGARGETSQQMASALSLPDDPDRTSTAFHTLSSDLEQRGNSEDSRGSSSLNIADALWCDQSFQFGDTFLTTLKDDFGAEIRPTDFLGEPDDARDEINDWVAEQTDNRIEGVVPE